MEYSVSLWYKYIIVLKNLGGGDYIIAQNKETNYCVISENKTQVGDDKNFVKNLRVYSS